MDDDEAYDVSLFALDWERELATCPQGRRSRYWKPAKRVKDRETIPMVQVHFHRGDCAACSSRQRCTRKRAGPRELTLHVQAHHEAMVAARAPGDRRILGAVLGPRWGRGSRLAGRPDERDAAVDWLDGVPRSVSYQSPFSALMAA